VRAGLFPEPLKRRARSDAPYLENCRVSLRNAAFTLIEMVLSVALMSLILTGGYLCLNAAFASQKIVEPRSEILHTARVAMGLLTSDLRSACTLSPDVEFLGMERTVGEVRADNLDFATHHYKPKRLREGDYAQISYFVESEPATGELILWRRRNPMIAQDPLSGGVREEIARGVHSLRVEYYDGYDWFDSWGELNSARKEKKSSRYASNLYGMPEAVRITLSFENDQGVAKKKKTANPEAKKEPPLVFQTVARLNLAAYANSTSTGGGSTNLTGAGSPDTGGNPSGGSVQR